jgi:hypothetical protein
MSTKRFLPSLACLFGVFILLVPISGFAGLEFKERQIEHHATLVEEQSTAVFHFTNTGDKPIEILKVGSSCGCTVPQLDKKLYAPGESGEINAVFTFGSRQGRQMKRITVTTNDPVMSRYQLDFITHIPTWGQIRPRMARWSVGGDSLERIITVELPVGDGLTFNEPQTPENFTMELASSMDGKRVYRLIPHSTEQGVTEKIAFELTYENEETSVSRELSFYALIR